MTISHDDVLITVGELDFSGAERLGRDMDDPDELDYLHQSYELDRDWPWKVALAGALLAQASTHDDYTRYLGPADYRIDVLQAPLHHDKYGVDTVEWCKMRALGAVHSRYDTFQAFYDDRDLLHRTVDEVLAEHDLSVVPSEFVPVAVPEGPAAALSHAIVHDDLAEALRLIDSGLGVDCVLPHWRDDFTHWYWGERLGIPEMVEEMHSGDAETRGNYTPLTLAGSRGNRELVETLLVRGADVDARDEYGRTVLFSAAGRGWDSIVDELLDRGAEADIASDRGERPLQLAVEKGHLSIVERLVKAGVPLRPRDDLLRRAARADRARVLEYLLGDETPTEPSRELVHTTASHNNLKSLEVLLERGIDIEYRDEDGTTPLMIAAKRGYPRIVSRLLAAGADPDAVDSEGRNASDLRGGLRPSQVYELLTDARNRP